MGVDDTCSNDHVSSGKNHTNPEPASSRIRADRITEIVTTGHETAGNRRQSPCFPGDDQVGGIIAGSSDISYHGSTVSDPMIDSRSGRVTSLDLS